MANIELKRTFAVCPEGSYTFKINRVDYDKEFGKVVVYMQSKEGYRHIERFNLIGADEKPNTPACEKFSFFAHTALNDSSRESIDHTELVGCYIGGEIVHNSRPNINDPTKTITFANLRNMCVVETKKEEAPSTEGLDLNSLLN